MAHVNSSGAAQRAKGQCRPGAFFDRDGVLNVDTGYTHRCDDLQLIAGAAAAVRLFNDAGWWVFVVSNQSGIARGYYDAAAVDAFHAALGTALAREGARIDAFYYCPHHPEGSVAAYARVCDCRKPQPGLIRQAIAEWPTDISHSILIGDRSTDMEAAGAAGLRGLLFPGGNLVDFCQRMHVPQARQ